MDEPAARPQLQLVTLGPGVEQYQQLHAGPIRDSFRELDLDPSSCVAVLGAADRSALAPSAASSACGMVEVLQGNDWVLSDMTDPEQVLKLESIGCQIPLGRIYAKIKFPEAGATGESTLHPV